MFQVEALLSPMLFSILSFVWDQRDLRTNNHGYACIYLIKRTTLLHSSSKAGQFRRMFCCFSFSKKNKRQVWSMIHSARHIVSPKRTLFSVWFVLLGFDRSRRTDVRTYDMWKNSYPYQPWLWVGRVDQNGHSTHKEMIVGSQSSHSIFWKSGNLVCDRPHAVVLSIRLYRESKVFGK